MPIHNHPAEAPARRHSVSIQQAAAAVFGIALVDGGRRGSSQGDHAATGRPQK